MWVFSGTPTFVYSCTKKFKPSMRNLKLLLLVLIITIRGTVCLKGEDIPKREFRGAWIHTVGNQQFKSMSADSIRHLFRTTLDIFEKVGVNAVIFQVRPQADAFYISSIEPWSRFLTGEQGLAPDPVWDPLQFIIEESHSRGMELHAWCNPYRVTSDDKEQLHPGHLYFKKPEIFKRYGNQLYFDPGEPESIEHTVKVISDLVTRYDIDAIHFDDYFYPYPVPFEEFHDDASFVKYAKGQGFEYWQKGDWRRNNVTTLIHRLNDTIKAIKPWVRFGISPFGIHRNLKDTPDGSGSNTNGLSNYEQLFADVPLWLENGWIDYNVPQLYWKIGHPAADYKTLIEWWNNADLKGHLYIGQNIATFSEPDPENPQKTQFEAKMHMGWSLPNVNGNVWWSGWALSRDSEFIDSLAQRYQTHPALIPAYTDIDPVKPFRVTGLKRVNNELIWEYDSKEEAMQEALFYAVYRFPQGVKPNIEDGNYLIKIVNEPRYSLSATPKGRYTYVITAIDRCRNESEPSKCLNINN